MRRYLLPLLSIVAVLATASLAADMDDSTNSPRIIQIATRAGQPAHQRVTLGLGKAVIVEIDADARDVLVSNPEIVDAVVRTPRRVFLMGQKGGQTNAFFFDGAGKQLASIDIRVEKDVTDLGRLIHLSFPDTDIKATAINDTVVLSGHVASAAESSRAQDIAARFAGDPAKVVNVLQIKSSEQVMLKVRVAEMQRTIAKQFGVDLSGALVAAGIPMAFGTSNPFGLVGHALSDLSGGQVGSACAGAFFPNSTGSSSSSLTTGDQTVTTVTNGVTDVVRTIATGVPTVTRTINSTIPCTSPNNMQASSRRWSRSVWCTSWPSRTSRPFRARRRSSWRAASSPFPWRAIATATSRSRSSSSASGSPSRPWSWDRGGSRFSFPPK
jgi:pilus assembly protein CpaC